MSAQVPVIAGVDTSAQSRAAVRYAAEEARQRSVPLVVVHAYTWPWIDLPLTEEDLQDAGVRDKAGRLLARTADDVRAAYPDLTVIAELVDGAPAAVLVERSRTAALLVLGHRGEGGFAELLAGSVAVHAAAHAHCPLVVDRGAVAGPDAPIVVGVDGSAHNETTLRFAMQTASQRKAPVLAVAVGPPHPDEKHVATAQKALTSMLPGIPAEYPDVTVNRELCFDRSPAAALIRVAQGAGLVVVGPTGHGGLRGILLGSVGRALIEHAPCPVAIVRSRQALGNPHA